MISNSMFKRSNFILHQNYSIEDGTQASRTWDIDNVCWFIFHYSVSCQQAIAERWLTSCHQTKSNSYTWRGYNTGFRPDRSKVGEWMFFSLPRLCLAFKICVLAIHLAGCMLSPRVHDCKIMQVSTGFTRQSSHIMSFWCLHVQLPVRLSSCQVFPVLCVELFVSMISYRKTWCWNSAKQATVLEVFKSSFNNSSLVPSIN